MGYGLDDFDDDPNSSTRKFLRRFKWHGYMKGNTKINYRQLIKFNDLPEVEKIVVMLVVLIHL